jgi:hypothetical protein
VRLARCDVRDHISDHRRSYRFCRALQWLRSPTFDIREIFGSPRFSTFSTVTRAKQTAAQQSVGVRSRPECELGRESEIVRLSVNSEEIDWLKTKQTFRYPVAPRKDAPRRENQLVLRPPEREPNPA